MNNEFLVSVVGDQDQEPEHDESQSQDPNQDLSQD